MEKRELHREKLKVLKALTKFEINDRIRRK